METKNWWWVAIACLAIVAVHQIVKLTGGDSAQSPPAMEPASQPERQTTHTASLAELLSMPEEEKPQVKELARIEEQQETSAAAIESSDPSPEEQQEVPAEVAETAQVQDPPSPVSDQPMIDTNQPPPPTAPVVESSKRGLVRGIVYSEDHGSAVIDETMVKIGVIIDGVTVVNIHAGGVEFEKDGHRWTQKVGEAPGLQWLSE